MIRAGVKREVQVMKSVSALRMYENRVHQEWKSM